MDADALYDLPPEAFTAARNDLAKQLRAAGEKERAAEVAGLRRPTAAAWAVNQVARRDPEVLAAVLDAGEALVREQRRALSGVERADLRGASALRRSAVDAAVAAARDHLERAGSDPSSHESPVRATFEAASVDPDAAERVRAGRLERDLPAPSGLDGLGGTGGLSLVPARGAAGKGDAAKGDAGKGDAATRGGRKRGAGTGAEPPPSPAAKAARAAQRRAQAARVAASEARDRADAARAERERAKIRADEAAQAVGRAREELERAEARAAEAGTALEDAALAAEHAAEEAAAAEGDADDLAEDARRAAARAGS